MAQNQILIRYDGMQQAATYYTSCAEELRELCRNIKSRNTQLVENDWNGQAAVAFEQRFNDDHAQSIETVAVALDDISRFITDYIRTHSEDDGAQAGMLGM